MGMKMHARACVCVRRAYFMSILLFLIGTPMFVWDVCVCVCARAYVYMCHVFVCVFVRVRAQESVHAHAHACGDRD